MSQFSERRSVVWSYVALGSGLMGTAIGLADGLTLLPVALFAIGTLLAFAPAFYAVFGRDRATPKNDDATNVHVGSISSTNQSGGFTGVQINQGKTERRFSQEQLNSLAAVVPMGDVSVEYISGDADAAKLASQVSEFLTARGYRPTTGSLVLTAPLVGVHVLTKETPPVVRIGHAE